MRTSLLEYPSEVFPDGLTWKHYRGSDHSTICDSCANATGRGMRVKLDADEHSFDYSPFDHMAVKDRPGGAVSACEQNRCCGVVESLEFLTSRHVQRGFRTIKSTQRTGADLEEAYCEVCGVRLRAYHARCGPLRKEAEGHA
jgi:hypothetical protein